ncbi:hypothetical protein [Blastococcus sp. TF02A-26]|uniref:hypothetical protein n=1 Tax=Blastococcus sp. TF02A-26 TaxID=2250577 RepID=UPI000DE8C4E7|nr:hypothetical protein [Blastococcus sp. TF02A-26]RBY82630.1 hypothetical protein DQ240_18150 [Blastococcus sp. TF02A-26]
MPTSTYRAVRLAAGTTALLAAIAVVMVVSTPEDAGANIGAGLVLLLVMVGSFATAVLLVRTGRLDAVLTAVVSASAWVAYVALAVDDTGPRWPALALIAVAVLAPAAWSLLVPAGSRRPR